MSTTPHTKGGVTIAVFPHLFAGYPDNIDHLVNLQSLDLKASTEYTLFATRHLSVREVQITLVCSVRLPLLPYFAGKHGRLMCMKYGSSCIFTSHSTRLDKGILSNYSIREHLLCRGHLHFSYVRSSFLSPLFVRIRQANQISNVDDVGTLTTVRKISNGCNWL